MRVVLQVSNGKTNLKRVVIQADTVIGRSTDCQLRVASSLVSRKHCQISVSDTRVSVTDLGSANGTFLNGKPLPPNVPTELSSGSEISIGPVQFLVQFQPPTAVEMPAFSPRYDSADSFSVDPEVHQAPAAVVDSPSTPAAGPAPEVSPAVGAGPAIEAAPVATPVIEVAPAAEPAVEQAAVTPVGPPLVEIPATVAPEPNNFAVPSEPVAEVLVAPAPPAAVEPATRPVDPVKPAVVVARVVARPVAPPAEAAASQPEVAAPPIEPVAPVVETVASPPPAIDDSEQTITAFPGFAGVSSENADEAAAFDFLNADDPALSVEINAAADDILEEPSVDLTETAPDPAPADSPAKPKRGFWNMLGMGKKTPTQKDTPAAPTPISAPAQPVVGPPESAGAPGSWDFAESEPAPAEAPPAADAEAGGEEDDALNDFFKNLP